MQVPRFSPRIFLIEMAPRPAPRSGCPGCPALPCLSPQTETMFAFIHIYNFLLKYMLGLLLILISKSWGCPPPLGVGHAFSRQWHMCKGWVYLFLPGFSSLYDAIHDGWRDEWMNGQVTWWKKLHKKRPRRPLLYIMLSWKILANNGNYLSCFFFFLSYVPRLLVGR